MRQTQKSDIVLGNFVMVNYRNKGCASDLEKEFVGEFYTGYYRYQGIYHKRTYVDRILPIIKIKEIDPNGEKIWFGSGCNWDSLIILEPQSNHDDYLEVEKWKKYNNMLSTYRHYSDEYTTTMIAKRWHEYMKKEEFIETF